ncbi:SH3 domain-containing protein [Reichenbachiella versicolor]|uniref:SH3 domain-containing protein n=1 Tax=Reichenbachiella versicolor TaxID=1821036 RepID=UPI000D6E7072|nr:SH3 domain-containing protein [Reichenbachiella versicolor]
MKHLLLLTLIFFLTQYSKAQSYRHTEAFYRVTSTNGLKLREKPSTNSKVITSIPYNNIVRAGGMGKIVSDTIENIIGTWMPSKFKEFKGYLFNPYIDRIAGEIFTEEDLGMICYYGLTEIERISSIYPELSAYYYNNTKTTFRIENINTLDYLTKKMEEAQGKRKAQKNTEERLVFMSSPTKIKVKVFSTGFGLRSSSSRVLNYSIDSTLYKYSIFALSETTISSNKIEPIANKSYRIILRQKKGDTITDQEIFSIPTLKNYEGECCSEPIHFIGIKWVGDIDGDQKLDLEISVQGWEWYTNYIYLSSRAKEGELVSLAEQIQWDS